MIDALLHTLPSFYQKVGFDVPETPFVQLTSKKSLYKHGYHKFNLGMFCDGYIYQGSLSEYSGVTPIEDFITAENLETTKQQSPNPSYKEDSLSAEDLNEIIEKYANITHKFRNFK
jgi:hypothetical protein